MNEAYTIELSLDLGLCSYFQFVFKVTCDYDSGKCGHTCTLYASEWPYEKIVLESEWFADLRMHESAEIFLESLTIPPGFGNKKAWTKIIQALQEKLRAENLRRKMKELDISGPI